MRGKRRKAQQGVVVSDQGEKSIVVAVERRRTHPVFGKIVKRTARFLVHDENDACHVGDIVEIMEIRPMSARKRWRLVKILGKSRVHERVRPQKAHEDAEDRQEAEVTLS